MNFKDMQIQDLKVFFNSDEFGSKAIYSATGATIECGLASAIEGESSAYIDILTVYKLDVPNPKRGDTFTIDSKIYSYEGDSYDIGDIVKQIKVVEV